MSELPDPPEFLRRNPKGQTDMTASAPAATPALVAPTPKKKRRTDCYVTRLAISIPLDMANTDTLAEAIAAVAKLKAALPANALVETISAGLGKMAS